MLPDGATINYRRVVDLSHVIHEGMPRWPGDPPFTSKAAASLEREGYRLNALSIGEHSGTHMNAPSSFHAGGVGADTYPAHSLVVEAVVIDVREQTALNPDYSLDTAALMAWETRWGPVPSDSLVLLHSGWDRRWNNPEAFFGYDSQGCMHFPGFGEDAARFLLEERGVRGLGTDAPGLDPAGDRAFTINRLVLERPRLALECMDNLGELPPKGSTIIIGVLKMRGGAGSPASVIALIP